MKTQIRHLIILMTLQLGLLGMADVAFGQDPPSWTGQKKNPTTAPYYYVLDADRTLGATCKLEGDLTIKIKHDGTSHTISKNYNGLLFESYGHNLTIEGEEGSVITLDGAGKKGDLVRCDVSTGNVVLTYVNLQNAYDITTESGNGRAICAGSSFTGNIIYTHGVIDNCTSLKGAAIYIDSKANNTITFTDVEIKNCKAYLGGAIRTAGSTKANMILDNCYIHDNEAVAVDDAPGYGGGIYWNAGGGVENATCELTIRGNTRIIDNESPADGAGIFVETAMTIESAIISGNKSGTNGGGICVHTYANPAAGTRPVSISNCTIRKNSAPNGGGLYVTYPDQTITLGSTVNIKGNTASTGNGGGVYMDSGNLTVSGATIDSLNNAAGNGGGIYAIGGTITVTSSAEINDNTANNGGGIYANGGTVDFSNGSISNNTATNDGGGIYVYSSGTFNISGSATMTGNNVENGQGGGVYQGGTMNANGSLLSVTGNTKGAAKTLTANNVYLPDNKTITIGDNISPNVSLGIYTQKTYDENSSTHIPVLYSTNTTKLGAVYTAMTNGESNIRDDRGTHRAEYTSGDLNQIYFTKVLFDRPEYSKPFAGPINSVDSLYKFMCWVNGLNGFPETHPGATGNVTADINMSGINHWFPIGQPNVVGLTEPYVGVFNGNGHTISNLTFNDDLIKDWGLFGTIDAGAQLNDVFVEGINLTAKPNQGGLGTLVGRMLGGMVKQCIGSGTLSSTNTSSVIGGLVGKQEGGIIHSSSAMAVMTGYTMGGLVGTNSGNLYNSFANPKFTYSGSGTEYVGGLVAENSGTVQNCYVRFSRENVGLSSAKFGQLAGDAGSSLISICYTPGNYDSSVPNAIKYDGSLTSSTYGDVVAPYKYDHSGDNAVGSNSTLLDELNHWVTNNSGYAPWKRTRAGGYISGQDINGDYPIHKYSDYHCVASVDGITLDYAATLDAMLARHNTSGTTINLYTADAIGGDGNNAHTTTATGVVVYVDEDVCVLPEADKDVRANTCQTLRTYAGSRWHDVSSSLQDSKIGFTYGTDDQQPFSWLPNPCNVTLESPDNESLFPTDLGDLARCDLYCFYEPEYHWLNLKRNTNSHWHMNATNVKINYIGNGTGSNGNEDHLVPGKGYLVSINQNQLLENEGILNRGNVTLYNVTKTNFNAWAERLGFNLLGNPYQSYLDFEEFITENGSNLWDNGSEVSEYNNTFAIFDPSLNSYVQYKNGTSYGSYGATQFIHPHQGFFIRMTKGSGSTNTTTVTYTNAMRSLNGDGGEFRGEERPAYPLINFLVRDSEGNGDVAVLELSRSNVEGALKIRMGDCTGSLSLGYDGKDYGVLFRTEVEDYQSLRFKASEEGTFTLEWNTANGEFSELTLIDNIAGTTTDMLSRDSYSFEGNPDQYASRFKIVIGDYKDIEDHEVPEPVEGPTSFAFVMGDELVVNGEGTLEITDLLGRVIRTETLNGSQSMTALPATAGVYVLRLTNMNATKTQKIILE